MEFSFHRSRACFVDYGIDIQIRGNLRITIDVIFATQEHVRSEERRALG